MHWRTTLQINTEILKNIIICNSKEELGRLAGLKAAELIKNAINEQGQANIILATGASQFETLGTLVKQHVDWNKVVMFHLDEYIDLPETSPASFRHYLKERFVDLVVNLKEVHYINGENDPSTECRRLGRIISEHPVDVALVGIGENGHLAFNDPPADFETEEPYIIVELDDKCRKQQLGEGWFRSIDDVPREAISMSIKQILKSKSIICSVPDQRKALAVKNSMEAEIDNMVPATILKTHPYCYYFLDKSSSSLLSQPV